MSNLIGIDKPKPLDDKMMRKMHALCNAFAREHIPKILDNLEQRMKSTDGAFIWSRAAVEVEIGKTLALAYSSGYADAVENKDVRKLIF